MSFTRGSTALSPGSNPHLQRPSPQPSDFAFPPDVADPIPEQQELQPTDERAPSRNSHQSIDNPDHDGDNSNHHSDEDAPQSEHNLARSLELLAKNIAGMSKDHKPYNAAKPRTPDTFDGTDPTKIDTFIFQCSMYLAARSADFPEDESRVTFSLSYLKGTPLDWFQTELNHSMTRGGRFPKWFTSYPEFLAELQRLFGPRDPVNDATNAIEALRYKDSTKAT